MIFYLLAIVHIGRNVDATNKNFNIKSKFDLVVDKNNFNTQKVAGAGILGLGCFIIYKAKISQIREFAMTYSEKLILKYSKYPISCKKYLKIFEPLNKKRGEKPEDIIEHLNLSIFRREKRKSCYWDFLRDTKENKHLFLDPRREIMDARHIYLLSNIISIMREEGKWTMGVKKRIDEIFGEFFSIFTYMYPDTRHHLCNEEEIRYEEYKKIKNEVFLAWDPHGTLRHEYEKYQGVFPK
jgi:hypothetical protein